METWSLLFCAIFTASFMGMVPMKGVKIEKKLEGIILKNWRSVAVLVELDESIEDIELAIKYEDHGDDFLIIKTKDQLFEYGWYLNRLGYPDYGSKSFELDNSFVKKPTLYYKFDERSSLSNEIFRYVHEYITDWHGHTKQYSKSMAQLRFDWYIEFMNDVSHRGVTYDHSKKDRDILMDFLEKNDIKTDENLAKLDSVKFSSKINGADGIAGKKELSFDRSNLHGDYIDFIYHKGKFVDLDDVKIKNDWDEDFHEVFELNLTQFD